MVDCLLYRLFRGHTGAFDECGWPWYNVIEIGTRCVRIWKWRPYGATGLRGNCATRWYIYIWLCSSTSLPFVSPTMPADRRSNASRRSNTSVSRQTHTVSPRVYRGDSRCVTLRATDEGLQPCLRWWATRGVRALSLVQELRIVGDRWTLLRSSCAVSLSCVRAILALLPNCVSVMFRQVLLCCLHHPRLFPVTLGRLTSLGLVDCVLVTGGLDAVDALAQCSRLRRAILSNVVWFDAYARSRSTTPCVGLPIRALSFFAVSETTVWRVGNMVHALAQVLCRLHIGFLPTSSPEGACDVP